MEVAASYESGAASQFVLYGNIHDRFFLGAGRSPALGSLRDFFLSILLPKFDVILSYDLGNGIRVERGGDEFAKWPPMAEAPTLPKAPRAAVETLTHYFRYCSNLTAMGRPAPQVALVVGAASLVAPAVPGALNYDLSAIALLMREWSNDARLTSHALATFLLAENLNDLHPLLVNNPAAVTVKVPLPEPAELAAALEFLAPTYPVAMAEFAGNWEGLGTQLRGASFNAIESRLRRWEHAGKALGSRDLVAMRREIVERECDGLIEFIEPTRTLDDVHGQPKLKEVLRQDFALWRANDLRALPMGYLVCGPVGTGKTYLVECLAGEAGVPVVKLKNFRDKWVGSTEGNLEKIFRLLQALGRCFVFVDEADQVLGRRDAGGNDGGLSGRIYSMFATEMSNPANRGKVVWVLATSRPDLVEVDLKRPGRIDVKVPIFPTTTAREAFDLLAALCRRREVEISDEDFAEIEPLLPGLLTPGAADALAVKIYRTAKLEGLSPVAAVKRCLVGYQHPVPVEVLEAQIRLAVAEASDMDFVPEVFR